jgi:hypothetical protein
MGVEITITGTARVLDDDTGEALRDPKRLARVGKLRHAAELISKYLDNELAALGLEGGDICLTLDSAGTRVLVQSTFTAPQPLTEEQVASLARHTMAQWSDGIGEACFDEAADKYRVTIDLQPGRRAPKVTQIEDGKRLKTKKPPTSSARSTETASKGMKAVDRLRLDIPADIYAAMSGPKANKTGRKRSAYNGQLCEVVNAGPDEVRIKTPSGDVFWVPRTWLKPE